MAERGAGHIVLLSRSGRKSSTINQLIEKCDNLGTTIYVMECDVADESSIQALIRNCATKMPPIFGVIQAAMVLRVGFPYNNKIYVIKKEETGS